MLCDLLPKNEYDLIPEHVRSKIEKFLNSNSDEYLTLKASHEIYKKDIENKVEQVNSNLVEEIDKRESISLEYHKKCKEIEKLEQKLNSYEKQNSQLKNDILRYENESRTYRLQRDAEADEKSSLQAILNRRINELEHLKADYDSVCKKLEATIQDRIQALSQLDEIQSKKVELDFKEKRLDKEKELFIQQINLLTSDVTKHNSEVVELRRDYTSQLFTLQTQLQQKNEEINVLLNNEENYKATILNLTNKIDSLNERLVGQSEVENQLQQKYVNEIDSRTKLADIYKEMNEESNKKCDELAQTARELQKLLSDAKIQYEDLEQRFNINESTYEEHMRQKNETIIALKKELSDANNLIVALKQDNLNDSIENLSPHATAAYNIIRKGLTLTQMYTEYANVSEQLLIKTHDIEQLQNTFKAFIEELEGKASILKKRNEDYAEAMTTIDKISQNYDQLELEHNVLKEKCNDSERNVVRLSREREKLQQTISDLSRQVCFLLKEVEESRGGEILIKCFSDEDDFNTKSSEFLNSSAVISKKLVTFHDIQELQENNQKLLIALRELSEEYESAENKLRDCNKEELEDKIRSLESILNEKTEATVRQDKIIQMLKNQLKMYQMTTYDSSFNKSVCDFTDIFVEDSSIKKVKTSLIQTDNAEIENLVIEELRKELHSVKKELSIVKQEFESSTKEHATNEKMMLESLEKSEKSYQNISQDCKKLILRAENSEEKCKCLQLNIDSLKAQITALENKCKMYSQTVDQQEQSITTLRNEAMKAMSTLSRNEILLDNLKRECALLRESEARLTAERDVMKQDKQSHAYVLSNLESIKASIERSESECKLKMEERLESALKECSALRKRLQDEQDRYIDKLTFMENAMEKAKIRLEDEKKCSSELLSLSNSLKSDLKERDNMIEILNEKVKNTSCKSIEEMELLVKNLQNKHNLSLKEIEHHKELLNSVKKNVEDVSKLSEDFEKQLVSERENYDKYKKEMEIKASELEGEVAGLQKQNNFLQKRVAELSNLNQTSMINLNDELMEEKRKYATAVEDLNNLKNRITSMQNDLKVAIDAKLVAEKKYTEEMLKHTEDIKQLKDQLNVVNELQSQITILVSERDSALLKAESCSANWQEQENKFKGEMESLNERLNDVLNQNELLLNEIQELSLKMAIKQSQDRSSNEDLNSSSDQNADSMMQVVNYLRREKNLAISQLEALSSENLRLKSEIQLIKSQLEETRTLLKAEQDKSDISSTTAVKHAELINKVQTLNALSDSNRVLREERDKLISELKEVREKMNNMEMQIIIPLKDENERLGTQLELQQTETVALQKECARWRSRVTEVTEKMNLKNSEDLIKSLNVEREAHNKTLENLRSVKQDKTKIEDQIKKLQASFNTRIIAVEKERNDTKKENSELEAKIEKINHNFGELQKTHIIQETMISEMKSSNLQVKSIARKYKSQCQELTKQLKEMKTKLETVEAQVATETGLSAGAEIPVQEQDRLRQEVKQQIENEMNDRIKQLSEQLTTCENKVEKLLTENKTLQETVVKKEVRATDILKQARNRIETLKKEADSYKIKMQNIEKATREECTARQNVIISQYENRILKLDKDKLDVQSDRERLTREMEILSQRVTTLQRQLHSQQGVKTAVNSGQEKCNTEPPTANIKPMAGPSSSKSQQNQQPVTVTPWRAGSETPLASIRPMSMQTRTAAVLPTSQTSCCSASQSTVLVPPQQQLVDTSSNAPSIVEAFSSSPSSSHTDYNMPSTSSSVSHTPVRQVVVTPTQQTSHSAESTQDLEAECGNQELQSQASLSSQPHPSQVSQNQATALIITGPTVSQSQMPTVALVLPRIDLQNVSVPGPSSHISDQSVVASSQTATASLVSASNQTDSTTAQKRSNESYYQQDGEDSNSGQVTASNQHSQQQAIVASSIETAPEQSIIIASSQQSNGKTLSESSVASSNANSSNTVTTTQAGLKRMREMEVENSKSSSSETGSVQPQVKRNRRMEPHEDLFRNDINETNNADMLLRYGNTDVEYQVPTSSQRDQEFDNLVIDSEAEDELEEDEQTMPDDGIIDENDEVQEFVEDEEEVESEEVYDMETYDREEQDTTMTSYHVIEGPDIDEETVHVQDQDNEVEIDEESNEVPNQSGRSDNNGLLAIRRSLEQQTSEATSSENTLRAQSASISSNQLSMSLQFTRRPSTISPLNRQQNQQLLLSQGFDDSTGDDSIVPSTPTLSVPRRTDGFGEAVSSPQVPSGGRFTFNESNSSVSRAGVAQMVSEGIDDTRMDLSQLEENSSTGRSVPSTPLQSSPQDTERLEIGQSTEDDQSINEELSSKTNQQQQSLDALIDTETFQRESAETEFENVNEENLRDESVDQNRDDNDGVTSDSGQSETQTGGTSQNVQDDLEEGREAEAATKDTESLRQSPQPIPTTGNNTARRSAIGRVGRPRGSRSTWAGNTPRTRNSATPHESGRGRNSSIQRDSYRGGRYRKQKSWNPPFGRY